MHFRRRSDVRRGLGRAHFDLTRATAAEQDSTVARALVLGASHVDVGQLPEEGCVVLAGPEGNEFSIAPTTR
ncbi:VOC family protein [Janibacter indicus]|uniref:VOC family protein n=1 Tax=Janibacter indicus TaxID=857417 RepID=UPI001CF2C39E|nr:VOC family protein [Janibacter indicus]